MDSKFQNWFKIEQLLTHSCNVFRKIFKDRWLLFTGQQWLDTQADGQAYITGIGQKTYQNFRNIQRIMLQTGDTNQWDLTVLLQVLRETKPRNQLNKTHKQRITKENNDLLVVTNIRNTNAHHPTKYIADNEFESIWSQLSTILISFGDDADEIAELKSNAHDVKQTESVDTANTIEAKRLKDLGNDAFRQMNFDEALKLFSQALVLPGLSDYDRSVLYSNRSVAYLEKRETSAITSWTDPRYFALQDAEHARDLRPGWWKAYFRIGQAHVALGEYEKAVHSLNKALALDPTNTELKNARDYALDREHYYNRQEHLDPRNIPRTTREQLNELAKRTGYSHEECEKVFEYIRKEDPGIDAVCTGHQYRDGDDNVKQNYELAARFYSKAVNLGNAEGMYNLALLHKQGLGVKKDIQAAIKLFQRAAAQSPTMSAKCPIPNIGVAESEHALGLLYETGVGVDMNHRKAAEWYQRASDHGSATAANNLGLMYGAGKGVEKNLDKSEQLLRLSVARGDSNGSMNLALLFLQKQDYQTAEHWCQSAIENNNILDENAMKIIYDEAEKERELFKKLNVERWEKQNGLSVNNLTYNERIQRKRCAENPSVARTSDAIRNMVKTLQSIKPVGQPFGGKLRNFDPTMLEEYSQRGYTFARQLLEAQDHFFKAMYILLTDHNNIDDRNVEFIKEFSTSIRIQHIVIQMSEDMIDEAKLIVDHVLSQNKSKRSQIDEDARVCFGYLHMNSLQSTIEFLTVCIRMYPKSTFFLELRGSLYGFLNKYDKGLADFNAALQLAPDEVKFLYDRASMLRLAHHLDLNETIIAYDKFARCAPLDHRKLPEAYYAIASCYLANKTIDNPLELAEEYYKKGIEAEGHQLPCFLPYESNNKVLMSTLFSLKPLASNKTLTESGIVSGKPRSRLIDPRRVDMIQVHRNFISKMRDLLTNMNFMSYTNKPRLNQNSPLSLIGLKGITLREMNPMKDQIYQGYVLSGLIFEQSSVVEPSICLLFEDDNGDLERLCIYNIPTSESQQLIQNTYIYGVKMSILNPYMRMTTDQKPAIRVDDVSSIILHGDTHNVKNMCRCCSKENASHVCSKCKRARYCSRECQEIDWKQYCHKLVCV